MKKDVNLGDTVWIAIGADHLIESKVVHIFEHFGKKQYVCEYPTHIDPVLEVRDWLSVSLDGKSLNLWKRSTEIFKQWKDSQK